MKFKQTVLTKTDNFYSSVRKSWCFSRDRNFTYSFCQRHVNHPWLLGADKKKERCLWFHNGTKMTNNHCMLQQKIATVTLAKWLLSWVQSAYRMVRKGLDFKTWPPIACDRGYSFISSPGIWFPCLFFSRRIPSSMMDLSLSLGSQVMQRKGHRFPKRDRLRTDARLLVWRTSALPLVLTNERTMLH